MKWLSLVANDLRVMVSAVNSVFVVRGASVSDASRHDLIKLAVMLEYESAYLCCDFRFIVRIGNAGVT